MAKAAAATASAAGPADGIATGGRVPAPVAHDPYTSCFQLTHPGYGHLRVKADTSEQAIGVFLARKCQGVAPERVREHLRVVEVQFVPAATERDKPYGWSRDEQKLPSGK